MQWKVSRYFHSFIINTVQPVSICIGLVHTIVTYNAHSFRLTGLAKHADVVVHEATNTFLPGVDKVGNMRLVTKDAKIHGHSTPAMVSACILPLHLLDLCPSLC